jgi:hypothetical protein
MFTISVRLEEKTSKKYIKKGLGYGVLIRDYTAR